MAKTNSPQLAWHFVGETLRDGSPIPRIGYWLTYTGRVAMCSSGLHASRHPFDALQYAPGSTLCHVEVGDICYEDTDKLVARQRKIIAKMDFTEPLQYFARMQALSVIHIYPNGTDDIVFDYLMTGNKTLETAFAAWAAARDAARNAARAGDAAGAAAGTTAMAATGDTARTAARTAAWAMAAAMAAARAAAGDTAMAAAKQQFADLVHECFGNV